MLFKVNYTPKHCQKTSLGKRGFCQELMPLGIIINSKNTEEGKFIGRFSKDEGYAWHSLIISFSFPGQ